METKSHLDYLEIIGGNRTTVKGWSNKQWNKYYHMTYTSVVRRMLEGVNRGTVLDVGTSNGSWYEFLESEKFERIYGVEVDAGRAELARQFGYHEVFSCDAADTPLPDGSLDVAVANSVFVHILRTEDKIRVLRRMEKLLKPGGCLIFDHASARAHFGEDAYKVRAYCSFISLGELIRIVHQNTSLRVADVYPTYFHWRHRRPTLLIRLLRRVIVAPFVPYLLYHIDQAYTVNRLAVEESDTFYLKLAK